MVEELGFGSNVVLIVLQVEVQTSEENNNYFTIRFEKFTLQLLTITIFLMDNLQHQTGFLA